MSGTIQGGASADLRSRQIGPDIVKLLVDGKEWTGWQEVTLTCGLERVPASFEVRGTDRSPSTRSQLIIKPTSTVVVQFGNSVALTGYVDRYAVTLGPRSHDVVLGGRSKVEDLVDCQVDMPGNSIKNVTLLQLAQAVTKAYDITVKSLNGPGPVLPLVNFYITQSPMDIILQAARYCQFLVYDDVDGSLVLAQSPTQGAATAASGFTEGVNIEKAAIDLNVSGRFSEYRVFIQSTDALLDGGTISAGTDPNRIATVKDAPNAIRHRVFSSVAEAGMNYLAVATQQANWELNRRRGRSQSIRLTTDTWYDKAGHLWRPNTFRYGQRAYGQAGQRHLAYHRSDVPPGPRRHQGRPRADATGKLSAAAIQLAAV